jgi:hypothetical protein
MNAPSERWNGSGRLHTIAAVKQRQLRGTTTYNPVLYPLPFEPYRGAWRCVIAVTTHLESVGLTPRLHAAMIMEAGY